METIAIVRAIPYPPHKRRWCGLERWVPDAEKRPQQEMEELAQGGFRPRFDDAGKPIWAKHALPWPASDVKVRVVDEPAPFDPNANGGVPQEISPTTFAMLKQDPRILVQVLTGTGGDPAEVVHAKHEAAELEQKLHVAERKIAGFDEKLTAAREQGRAEAAAELAAVRKQLAEAQTIIASGGKKK